MAHAGEITGVRRARNRTIRGTFEWWDACCIRHVFEMNSSMAENVLIERIRALTGITETQARVALFEVLGYLRGTSPPPREETGCCPPVSQRPEDLAERALQSLTGMFGPEPAPREVEKAAKPGAVC